MRKRVGGEGGGIEGRGGCFFFPFFSLSTPTAKPPKIHFYTKREGGARQSENDATRDRPAAQIQQKKEAAAAFYFFPKLVTDAPPPAS